MPDLKTFPPEMMTNSNFYLLRRLEETKTKGYDRMEGCIVIANSPKQARKLAYEQAIVEGGDNMPDMWLDHKLTSCKQFGKWQFKRPSVILVDRCNG